MIIELQDFDVLSMKKGESLTNSKTSRIDEIKAAIKERLSGREQWLDEGIECEMLQVGRHWQSGKIRLKLEFIPAEVSSPLDDLRSNLTD